MDGQGAFLREPARHNHITFFQSFERFHWISLPTKLPLERKEAIDRDPAVLELEGRIAILIKQDSPSGDLLNLRAMLSSYRRAFTTKALESHREQWLQTRKETLLLCRGSDVSEHDRIANLFKTLYLVFPERAQLINIITLKNEII